MHVVEDSKIRTLGEEIRFRSAIAKSDVKFSDFTTRNLILSIKKEDGRFDTYSNGHLPDMCYTYLDNQKKYFDEMFNKNNSMSILYGFTLDSNKIKFVPLYDLTNKHALTTFFHIPFLSRFKNQDKILCLIDDALGYIVSDYDNIPLIALFKYVSPRFLKPSIKWDGTESGIKLVLAILALENATKCPTIHTSLEDMLSPSAELEFPEGTYDVFVEKFYGELVTAPLIIDESKIVEDDTEKILVNKPLNLPLFSRGESVNLSELAVMRESKNQFITFLINDGVQHFIIDYPSLKSDYYECNLLKSGWIIFCTKNKDIGQGDNYEKNLSRLKRMFDYEKISILTDHSFDSSETQILM